MNQYELLVDEAEKEGIIITQKNFKSDSKGLCKGNKIAIRKDIPTLCEKTCILAEEIGHFYTTIGNIIDLRDIRNRKQELKARIWSYNKLIGLVGIIGAFNNNCLNLYEMAEYLNVTEDFLQECIDCYRNKYGTYTKQDNYIIYFIPYLAVFKIF